ITPAPTSRPKALPPESATACTCWAVFSGANMSVCAVPGAPPRTSTPATAPFSHRTTVQPVGRLGSVKWPTLMPSISVSPPQRSDGTVTILLLRRALYLQRFKPLFASFAPAAKFPLSHTSTVAHLVVNYNYYPCHADQSASPD